MILIVLSAVLVLALGGCACVVWAARGGPRWTRGVSRATLLAGELVRASGRSRGDRNRGSSGSSDGGD
ncbi:hypothetical protein [Streptomyces sp. AC512_CC834]|uniref:hypothetical protein n=1 Tax=Streptomyces sp. AC512_CC834 TaxID=2823691 RepID=UPI001C258FAA|nr:hypothetical protein [Streptomyces sp. AC512_CC834]